MSTRGGTKKADINKGGCVDSVPNKDKGEEIQIPGAGDRHLGFRVGVRIRVTLWTFSVLGNKKLRHVSKLQS